MRALTRVLTALDADAKAVRRLWRTHHVDGPHHQVLVHVKVMVVLLRTTRRAGHSAPPPAPWIVCYLVARAAATPRPKEPQNLLGWDGPLLSVRAHVVMVMVVRPGVAERGGGAQIGAPRVLARSGGSGGALHDGIGSTGWGVVETRAPPGWAASTRVHDVFGLVAPRAVGGLVRGLWREPWRRVVVVVVVVRATDNADAAPTWTPPPAAAILGQVDLCQFTELFLVRHPASRDHLHTHSVKDSPLLNVLCWWSFRLLFPRLFLFMKYFPVSSFPR
jgi:hypothetical protein